ncbi:MAG: MATE family efflux transporter [Bacteroidaceae bacterium]|nr:MATE family efflux transporter [Bacteroidaceae bacterium]
MERVSVNSLSYTRQLLKIGIPIMIGQLGIIVVGFADNIMVGHHSSAELAAASFVNNLFNLSIMFGLGFSYGLTPIIGTLVGGNKVAQAGRMLRNSLYVNGILGFLLMGAMTVVYTNVGNMGQPVDLLPLIKPYFLTHLFGLCFVMLFNSFRQFADGIMDTRISMMILLSGNVVNIVGNYLLIFGKAGFPEMGLLGAGISTLFSRIFTVAVFIWIFFMTKRYNRFRIGFIKLKSSFQDSWQLVRLGMPVALQMGMETGAFNLSVIMIGWIGSAALAAHQVVGTITTIGFMLYYGVGAAITILISNNRNDGHPEEFLRIARAGFRIIVVMVAFIVVSMGILRDEIGYLFTDDTDVITLVAALIVPTMVYQLGDGLQVAYANALRGIEDVKPMAIIAFVSYFAVCLPAGYFFGFVLQGGASGIWWGFPIGLTLAGVLFYFRFRWNIKRMTV